MVRWITRFGVIFICLVVWVESESPDNDMFSSISEMSKLAVFEKDFTSKLSELVKIIENKVEVLEKIMLFKIFSSKDHFNSTTNPIKEVLNIYVEEEQLRQKISEGFMKLPPQTELEGAGNGIFLLQETYKLNVTLFSDGVAQLPQGGPRFSSVKGLLPEDIEFMSKIAFNRGFYDRAVDWAKASLMKAKSEGSTKERLKVLKKLLSTTVKHHDKVLDQKGPSGSSGHDDSIWRTNLLPFDEKLRKKKKYKKVRKEKFVPRLNHLHSSSQSWDHFNRLCAGEKLIAPEQEKEFKCYFLKHNDPFVRLGPFKLDVQHINPFVAVFRDFMYDAEMEHYKAYARNKLHRSSVQTKKSTVITRTSKQTWLDEFIEPLQTVIENNTNVLVPYKWAHDDSGYFTKREKMEVNDKVALRISDRITLASRLYTPHHAGGEPYQIANYGIGGVYNAHPDPFGWHGKSNLDKDKMPDMVGRGDRLATFMGYLSDVQLGGATVFPNLGVSIAPEKGSAAFWWNLFSNGASDTYTVHGGCPVIVGSKWITNKWIRWKAQELTYPCDKAGFIRHKGLHESRCEGKGRCETSLRKEFETFYHMNNYYDHLKSISTEFK